jgi:O-antigen/teichoic acid export membrane protein
MSNQELPETRKPADKTGASHLSTEHLKKDLGGRTARGGMITMTSHGVKFVITMAATIVMARLLTPRDYGLIAMVVVVTNYMTMFKDMGLSLATVQRAEISDEQISTLFWINVVLAVGITLITIAISPAIVYFYGEPRLLLITVVISLGFILGGLSVQHEALLKRQMRFVALSAISIIALVTGYAVGILLAWKGAGYWAIVGSQLALIGTTTLGTWIASGWIPGRPRRYAGVRPMLAFGRNVTGYATLNVFARNFDTLVLGRYWGPQNLGLYNKSQMVLSIPTDQMNEPFSSVAIPALSRLTDSPERYREAYVRILEKVALLTFPAVAMLMAASDWVVRILLGPQWTDSARLLVVLGIATMFQPVVSSVNWLFITQGRTRHMFQWAVISAPLSIITIAIGLPWGPLGVAISYIAGRLLLIDHLLYWFIGRTGPVRTSDIYRTIIPIAAASGFGFAGALGFRRVVPISNPLLGCVATGLVVALVTYLSLFVIPAGRRALSDIRSVLRMLVGNSQAPIAGA